MSKVIKVEDQVYVDLDKLRGKSETFSLVIEALLSSRLQVFTMLDQLEVQLKYREWQQERLQELRTKEGG